MPRKNADLQEQLDALRKENTELKEAKKTTKLNIWFKVSEKGALSVYGLGRFPTSLYAGQWQALLNEKEAILAFMSANADKLKKKNDEDLK